MKKRDPLHVAVAADLRRHVRRNFAAGDILDTITALSRRFDVSTNTLRAAQSLLCHEGLLVARQGSGVYVTDLVNRNCVAIVSELDLLHPLTSPYYRRTTTCLRDFFVSRDVPVRLYVGRISPQQEERNEPTCWDFAEDLKSGKIQGVILVATTSPTATVRKLLEQLHVPAVGAANSSSSMMPNAERRVRTGFDHLWGLGCRRIALMTNEMDVMASLFRRVAAERGMDVPDGWIQGDLHPTLSGAGWEEFMSVWNAHTLKPDGLLCADDFLFEGVKQAVQDRRIQVPEQLRIVTQSNKGASVRCPFPVTFMEVDPTFAATRLGENLLSLMKGEEVRDLHVDVPFKMVEAQADGHRAKVLKEI